MKYGLDYLKFLFYCHIIFFLEELKKLYSNYFLIKNSSYKNIEVVKHNLNKYKFNNKSSKKILITQVL